MYYITYSSDVRNKSSIIEGPLWNISAANGPTDLWEYYLATIEWVYKIWD